MPFYVAEGKSYLTIAIGCTGGRHRSVMIAERLRAAGARATRRGASSAIRHRDGRELTRQAAVSRQLGQRMPSSPCLSFRPILALR